MVRTIWSFGHGNSGIYKVVLLSATDKENSVTMLNLMLFGPNDWLEIYDCSLGGTADSKWTMISWLWWIDSWFDKSSFYLYILICLWYISFIGPERYRHCIYWLKMYFIKIYCHQLRGKILYRYWIPYTILKHTN